MDRVACGASHWYPEALRPGAGSLHPRGLCQWPSLSPLPFPVLCGFPHTGEQLAVTWAPKAHKRVENYS